MKNNFVQLSYDKVAGAEQKALRASFQTLENVMDAEQSQGKGFDLSIQRLTGLIADIEARPASLENTFCAAHLAFVIENLEETDYNNALLELTISYFLAGRDLYFSQQAKGNIAK